MYTKSPKSMVTFTLTRRLPNLDSCLILLDTSEFVSSFYIRPAYSISHYLKANVASKITRLTLLVSTTFVTRFCRNLSVRDESIALSFREIRRRL